MTQTGATFLSSDWHESTRNVGGVLAAFVRNKFPRDTIKRTAQAARLHPARRREHHEGSRLRTDAD
jgi:hypothetical protein